MSTRRFHSVSEKSLEQSVAVPEDVEVSVTGKRVAVRGPLGEASKDFSSCTDLDRPEER